MSLTVPDFSAVRILVVGDLMLDQYSFGPTSRISPEAPVPVVRVTETEARAGGAANVAVNLSSLGAVTTVAGIVGKDANATVLRELLESQRVKTALAESADRPTITKLRVLSRNQQLLRLDTEETYVADDASMVAGILQNELPSNDICILSDYAKGTLGDVSALIAQCREQEVPVLVDPKDTDFTAYRGATVLTPNLAEFEAVAGASDADHTLVSRAETLRNELELQALVVTMGERGMLVVADDTEAAILPTRAREVYDVTGAGDTVIAVLAAGVGAGLPILGAAGLANLAAGLVVGKIGVASVTPSELKLALHEHGQGGRGLLAREEASRVAEEARARGERIVMTNGCFDLLHTGHVSYLQEAKTRGDRLMVAVNTDESVTRLKGQGRPINPLADRMAVLAGLAAVDWVVPFAEETPEQLVAEVLPDVLVKGGDYAPEAVAGGRIVLENGGSVEILSYREGRSTSGILDAIRKLS
jgi:D-beta-D-heptose 7-phosphate kinase/D-beta-D-heptose 1-phosphate adenosyltransferase